MPISRRRVESKRRATRLSSLWKYLDDTLHPPNAAIVVTRAALVSEETGSAFCPLTTGNPFLGTKLLGFSVGRGSGALKGLNPRHPRGSV